MNDRLKKILFVAGFVLISIGIALTLYFYFYKPLFGPQPATETSTGEGQTGELPTSPEGEGQPTVTTPQEELGGFIPSPSLQDQAGGPQEIATGVTLLRDGVTQSLSSSGNKKDLRFYNPEDGRFYVLNEDGSYRALSDRQFFNVQNINWGKQSDQAIMEFPDGNNILYDFSDQRQVTLPAHWEDFTFSPDDKKIVAKSIGLDEGNRFLVVADPNGNEAKAIQALGNNGDQVIPEWSPNNQVLAFSKTGRPLGGDNQEIYLLGEHQENFKSLIVPGRGFMPNWSPTGQKILYSVYNQESEFKPTLWISGGSGDNVGENRRALNLQTWADKCVWQDDQALICGVPQTLDRGVGMVRDSALGNPDDVYRIDLRTGVSIKINNINQLHPIRQPILSQDKKKLIFTDAVSGRLYSYDLP